jgi:hypothetical protein
MEAASIGTISRSSYNGLGAEIENPLGCEDTPRKVPMSQKQKDYVAVDDSGDAGFKPGSSGYFAVAAVVFNDSLEAESTSLEIKKYKRAIGWRDDHEFKFNKMRRDLIVRFIEEIVSFDFKVYSLYIDKKHVNQGKIPKEWDTVYNQVVLELLTRIPLHDAVIRIDGKYGKTSPISKEQATIR